MKKQSHAKWIGTAASVAALFVAVAGCGKNDQTPAPTPSPAPVVAPAGGGESIDKVVVPELTYSTVAGDVDKGKATFIAKGCNACHKVGEGKLVGPDLKGVTARREIKWIEKMILKPELMIKQDDAAKELFKTYMTPMANQNVDPVNELPFLLAYLKANEV